MRGSQSWPASRLGLLWTVQRTSVGRWLSRSRHELGGGVEQSHRSITSATTETLLGASSSICAFLSSSSSLSFASSSFCLASTWIQSVVIQVCTHPTMFITSYVFILTSSLRMASAALNALSSPEVSFGWLCNTTEEWTFTIVISHVLVDVAGTF